MNLKATSYGIFLLTLTIFVWTVLIYWLIVHEFEKKEEIAESLPMLKCANQHIFYIVEDYVVSDMELIDTKRGIIFRASRCQGYK